MQGEAAALAAIRAAFADPEPVTYIQPTGVLQGLIVVRLDEGAPTFDGVGATLRKITYQVLQADLADDPNKSHKLVHRDRVWAISDITRRDDIGEWDLVVSDAGPFE